MVAFLTYAKGEGRNSLQAGHFFRASGVLERDAACLFCLHIVVSPSIIIDSRKGNPFWWGRACDVAVCQVCSTLPVHVPNPTHARTSKPRARVCFVKELGLQIVAWFPTFCRLPDLSIPQLPVTMARQLRLELHNQRVQSSCSCHAIRSAQADAPKVLRG